MKLLLIIICLLAVELAKSQIESYSYLATRELFDTTQNKTLYFRVENSNFFKNNEYTTPILRGYTLIGAWGRFMFNYYASNKLNVRIGWNFQKYLGKDDFTKHATSPYYSIEYKPNKHLSLIFGNLNNNNNFGLITPLFEPERYFSQKPPGGVQIKYNNKKLSAQLWINWEQFILEGDPYQEKFTNATILSYKLIDSKKFCLKIPYQVTFNHHGGEIDSSDLNIETLSNSAFGLSATYKSKFWHWGIDNWMLLYKELTNNNYENYRHGGGFLTQLYGGVKNKTLSIGYFYGDKFISHKGMYIYQSFSKKYQKGYPVRRLITGRLSLKFNILKGSWMAIESDSFYDLIEKELSYSWGIHLFFTSNFFIKSFKNITIN